MTLIFIINETLSYNVLLYYFVSFEKKEVRFLKLAFFYAGDNQIIIHDVEHYSKTFYFI